MYGNGASRNEVDRGEARQLGREPWVRTWMELVGESLRGHGAPDDNLGLFLETILSSQLDGEGTSDGYPQVEKLVAICRRPPLAFRWVAVYLRDGKAFRAIECGGARDRQGPVWLFPNEPPVGFTSISSAQSFARYLPWLPLNVLVQGDQDGGGLCDTWVLPLLAFGELTGLLTAAAEDVSRCVDGRLVPYLITICAPVAIAFFVRQRLGGTAPTVGWNQSAGAVCYDSSVKAAVAKMPVEGNLFPELVGQSASFLHALALAQRWAAGCAPVLITGETGTGKELLARAIHALSDRRTGPWVAVNCPAIPRELAESELFGHEKGAFTGATEARAGRFERADGGVLFLDEVGDLPHTIQAKLLRVLQEGEIERVGSAKTKKVNVRVIAATNRDLQEAVRQGEFRKDLYHRLAALPIHLPPLRERVGDIKLLVAHFLHKSRERYGKRVDGLAPGVIEKLEAYDWPGNVRELEYVIERAVLLAIEPVVRLEDLGDLGVQYGGTGMSLHARLRLEKLRRVEATLRQTQGNCAEAARLLGMSRGNFARLLKALRVDPRRFRMD